MVLSKVCYKAVKKLQRSAYQAGLSPLEKKGVFVHQGFPSATASIRLGGWIRKDERRILVMRTNPFLRLIGADNVPAGGNRE